MKKISQWPKYDKQMLDGINKIIKRGEVNYLFGNWGKKFEKSFSKYHKIPYSIAVSNGTLGLELALAALELKKNDEVLVTPRSYYSSASCIIRNNLKPVFVDIDLNTQNILVDDIKKKITKKTKCIICVHLGGLPCEMDEIMKIAKKNKIKVIEDCSQAHGAMINEKLVGSFGDISVWSFCNDKIISTLGEGGMISTGNKRYYEKLWSLKDIGKNIKKYYINNKDRIGFQWIHDSIGTNARLTEIQSYAGYYQLKKLNFYIKKRNENANFLKKELSKINFFTFLNYSSNYYNSYYRFNFLFNPKYKTNKISRDILLKELGSNINIREGSCPEIYKEKFFKTNFSFFCPNAKYIGKNSLSLQVDHTIKKENLIKTVKTLKNFINKNY